MTMVFLFPQSSLGEEGTSLELRHIASHLLWYCGHHLSEGADLLHEVILAVGYFTVTHTDNQVSQSVGWVMSDCYLCF